LIELFVKVQAGRIAPRSMADQEALDGGDGDYVCRLTSARSRSLDQMRLYWSICAFIADALDSEPPVNRKMIDQTLKIEAGHYDMVRFVDGRYRYQPKSIAFNKLSQPAFNEYMDNALNISARTFGPAIAAEARAHLLEMMGSRSNDH
jgi:hypothetical protein